MSRLARLRQFAHDMRCMVFAHDWHRDGPVSVFYRCARCDRGGVLGLLPVRETLATRRERRRVMRAVRAALEEEPVR